ncbi:DivIVA domain-containing protein [Lactobacillus sp. ESL0680]|uniref:DivIVA domain-containing protein n=1 Tax=unclassified Lactobacillus TaxID=2620435 RepID=UPI0023FA0272|nr:DivIVA domain-containing protein [Lactobacillus sp. ESL0680]MDF7668431.1 DivIVA domain-containing protein [Lactobacillus sp. ESL0703]WEV39348.1 DivIVA domain-containing protein [Lactobacillus sp. ESL0680]
MADKKTQVKRLTPMDIHNQEFKKRGLNGYDRQQVDSFLDQVVDDYGDALDQTVDLKNNIVGLKDQVAKLQTQVDQYQQTEKAAEQTLANAQEQAQEIINNATQQIATNTNYERQQQETLQADYERLKKEIAGYRNHLQDLLQIAIDNLSDEKWQKALDKYFSTERFYPPDGSEPITLVDDDEDIEDDEELDELDNDDEDDVNFEEDIEEDQSLDQPHPMAGDSPSNETVNRQSSNSLDNDSGPVIIFPDDYKDHN